ncbi:MAG: sugar transferase [Balneola sp.]|nr:MAG: sugar transferase [Balneola sp.]
MTVRDTILQEAERSRKKIINGRFVFPDDFYKLTQKDYLGKRFLDIILSLIGFVPFLVIFPFLALGIRISSNGSILFKQKRTGRNGKSFTCYKFRTMHVFYDNPQSEKPALTQKKDVRIFSFGSFLRKSNLDELPQLFNVLKGDMSLVGPRPYMEDECSYWNKKFDDFYYRYAVKPGITGLSQVKGFRGGTFDENHMRERLNWDLIYVEKQSFWLDIKIIFNTVLQMLHLNTNAH